MGISIAEMLGMELPDEPLEKTSDSDASDAEGSGPDGPENSDDSAGSSAEEDSADPDADPLEEAVVAALLAESTVKAEDFRPDLTLAGDFDLDTIGRYAVISSIEKDLKITLKDSDINDARTLEDLIELVKANHR